MKVLHWLFPAGHFVISVLFLLAGLALVAIAGVQLWQGIHLFREAATLSYNFRFIVEAMGRRSNLVLVDQDGLIMDAARRSPPTHMSV